MRSFVTLAQRGDKIFKLALRFGWQRIDFAQNFFALCRRQNFASLKCADRKENNRIVAKRGQMCQMPKSWRRNAFGPIAARGRTGSSSTLRRAYFHAFAFKSCAQFARKFDGAGCIAVDTDRFAAHLDILAFD